jgi:hypothetical protein
MGTTSRRAPSVRGAEKNSKHRSASGTQQHHAIKDDQRHPSGYVSHERRGILAMPAEMAFSTPMDVRSRDEAPGDGQADPSAQTYAQVDDPQAPLHSAPGMPMPPYPYPFPCPHSYIHTTKGIKYPIPSGYQPYTFDLRTGGKNHAHMPYPLPFPFQVAFPQPQLQAHFEPHPSWSRDYEPVGYDVVYTDGVCRGNGQEWAVAGVGVWWGPDDPRCVCSIFPFSRLEIDDSWSILTFGRRNIAERCPGEQTNNRAELIVRVFHSLQCVVCTVRLTKSCS